MSKKECSSARDCECTLCLDVRSWTLTKVRSLLVDGGYLQSASHVSSFAHQILLDSDTLNEGAIAKQACRATYDSDAEGPSAGVHTSHCCAIHGCKYSTASCPIEMRTLVQEALCEECCEDIQGRAYSSARRALVGEGLSLESDGAARLVQYIQDGLEDEQRRILGMPKDAILMV